MIANVSDALAHFPARRLDLYGLSESYYYGEHRLTFATQKFRNNFGNLFKTFSDNLCGSVVDIQKERLEVIGFSTSRASLKEEDVNGTKWARVSDPPGERAWEIWEDNAMDVRADEVHRDSLLFGDGFVIVWPDADGKPAIWPQSAQTMAVSYSVTEPGVIDSAAKYWVEGDWYYITLYLPDEVRRYKAKRKTQPNLEGELQTTGSAPKPEEYTQFDAIPNEWGRVPVFHFPNRVHRAYGVSELQDVIPLQDALNKSVMDMMVGMEFQAFRQRWVTGMSVEIDPDTGRPMQTFEPGSDRVWMFEDPNVNVGEFSQADITQFTGAQEKFRAEISRVVGVPGHYFFVSGSEAPSGEALKTAELRFSRKIKNRQKVYGKIWEEVIKFACTIAGESVEDVDFNAVWFSDSPRSENEFMDVQTKKGALGVPDWQIFKELGYDDDQIKLFLEAKKRAPEPPNDDSPEAVQRRANEDQIMPPQIRADISGAEE